jgi:hypothetical protein
MVAGPASGRRARWPGEEGGHHSTGTGSTAVATGRDGGQHDVQLPADTAGLATTLAQANVDVTYTTGNVPLNFHWWFLLITVGYLVIVLLVIGSIAAAGVYFLRQILAGRTT